MFSHTQKKLPFEMDFEECDRDMRYRDSGEIKGLKKCVKKGKNEVNVENSK